MASRRFLSPSLLCQLERRWIFLQHSVSRGTLLFPHTAELFTRFKKTEWSSSDAELTISNLLHGLPCLMELCSNFQHGLLCPSQSCPTDLSGFSHGKEECGISHFITMSCSLVPWCLCPPCSLYLGNLSQPSLLGELTFLLQGSVYVLVPDGGLLHCVPTSRQNESLFPLFPLASCAISKMG